AFGLAPLIARIFEIGVGSKAEVAAAMPSRSNVAVAATIAIATPNRNGMTGVTPLPSCTQRVTSSASSRATEPHTHTARNAAAITAQAPSHAHSTGKLGGFGGSLVIVVRSTPSAASLVASRGFSAGVFSAGALSPAAAAFLRVVRPAAHELTSSATT